MTGGAGFIGSHVVDQLVAEGAAVTVLDNFATGSRDNLHDACQRGDVRVVDGSILDRPAIAEAIGGCDTVYHFAVECVRRSLGKPIENHEVNASGTLFVLEAARRVGVSRFVYCSSSEVYGNASSGLLNERITLCEPMTVYGAAKLAGEYYTKAYHRTYGLPTVVIRPFNSYGPREHDRGDLAEVIPRFVIRVLNGQSPVIFGSGENSRDFTYVTETARGIVLAGRSDVPARSRSQYCLRSEPQRSGGSAGDPTAMPKAGSCTPASRCAARRCRASACGHRAGARGTRVQGED